MPKRIKRHICMLLVMVMLVSLTGPQTIPARAEGEFIKTITYQAKDYYSGNISENVAADMQPGDSISVTLSNNPDFTAGKYRLSVRSCGNRESFEIKVNGETVGTVSRTGTGFGLNEMTDDSLSAVLELKSVDVVTIVAQEGSYWGWVESMQLTHVCDYTASGTAVPNSCETEGYTPWYCACGEFEKRDIQPAAGHQYGADNACAVCGTLSHTCSFEFSKTVAPTCTEKGYDLYQCTYTGCTKTEKRNEQPAAGHNYVNGICSVCDKPKHDFQQSATVTEEGRFIYNVEYNYAGKISENVAADMQPGDSISVTLSNNPDFTAGKYTLSVRSCGNRESFEIKVNGEAVGTISRTGTGFGQDAMTDDSLSAVLELKPADEVTIVAPNEGYGWVDNFALTHACEYTTPGTAIPNSCETEGYTPWYCACGEFEKRNIQPATGHQHTELRDAVTATCKTDGYTGDTWCTDCEKLVEPGTTVDKATVAHQYGADNACTVCGALSHICSFERTETVLPTCTEDGYELYKCTYTGCAKTEKRNEQPAAGHNYVNGICSVCDKPKHDFQQSATVTEEGRFIYNVEYNYSGDICENVAADMQPGDSISVTLSNNPDFTAGKYTLSVRSCGNRESFEIKVNGETVGTISRTGTGFGQDAMTDDSLSAVLELKPADEVTIVAPGEGYGWVDNFALTHACEYTTPGTAIPNSCETEGYTPWYCACGEFEKRDIQPATGHQHTELRDAVTATCKTDGYTGDTWCTDCEKLVEPGATVDKATVAHQYNADNICTVCGVLSHTCSFEFSKTVAPTCTQKGYDLYQCTYTGCTKTEKRNEQPVAEHNYVDGFCSVCEKPEQRFPQAETITEEGNFIYNVEYNYSGNISEDVAADMQPGESISVTLSNNPDFTAGKYTLSVRSCGNRESFEIKVNGETVGTVSRTGTGFGQDQMTDDSLNAVLELKPADEVTIVAQEGSYWGWVDHLKLTHACEYTTSGTAIPNSCETEGYTPWYCACGEFEKRDIQPATGHQHTELRDAVTATCKTDGYTGDTWCTDCEKLVEPGATVDKATVEHQYGEDNLCTVCGIASHTCTFTLSQTVAPTCAEGGYELYQCSYTGCAKTEKRNEQPAAGHDYVNGICSVCQEPKHDFQQSATVTEEGRFLYNVEYNYSGNVSEGIAADMQPGESISVTLSNNPDFTAGKYRLSVRSCGNRESFEIKVNGETVGTVSRTGTGFGQDAMTDDSLSAVLELKPADVVTIVAPGEGYGWVDCLILQTHSESQTPTLPSGATEAHDTYLLYQAEYFYDKKAENVTADLQPGGSIDIPLNVNSGFQAGTYTLTVFSCGNRTSLEIRVNGQRVGTISRTGTGFGIDQMTYDKLNSKTLKLQEGDVLSIVGPGGDSYGWVDFVILDKGDTRQNGSSGSSNNSGGNPGGQDDEGQAVQTVDGCFLYQAEYYYSKRAEQVTADLQPGESIDIKLDSNPDFTAGTYTLTVSSCGNRETLTVKVNGEEVGTLMRAPTGFGLDQLTSDKLTTALELEPGDTLSLVGPGGEYYGWVDCIILEPGDTTKPKGQATETGDGYYLYQAEFFYEKLAEPTAADLQPGTAIEIPLSACPDFQDGWYIITVAACGSRESIYLRVNGKSIGSIARLASDFSMEQMTEDRYKVKVELTAEDVITLAAPDNGTYGWVDYLKLTAAEPPASANDPEPTEQTAPPAPVEPTPQEGPGNPLILILTGVALVAVLLVVVTVFLKRRKK